MGIDPRHEKMLIEALRHLREAKSLSMRSAVRSVKTAASANALRKMR
jgi:hypothetical protein